MHKSSVVPYIATATERKQTPSYEANAHSNGLNIISITVVAEVGHRSKLSDETESGQITRKWSDPLKRRGGQTIH